MLLAAKMNSLPWDNKSGTSTISKTEEGKHLRKLRETLLRGFPAIRVGEENIVDHKTEEEQEHSTFW